MACFHTVHEKNRKLPPTIDNDIYKRIMHRNCSRTARFSQRVDVRNPLTFNGGDTSMGHFSHHVSLENRSRPSSTIMETVTT